MSRLHYEVLVHPGVPRDRPQRLPDGGPIVSSPLSSTLIYGDEQALLVDAPFTYDQTQAVVDWIKRVGKTLVYVYATHGHGDHWMATAEVLRHFPDAVPYATTGTIEVMKFNNQLREVLWDSDFPGIIPPSPIDYRVVPGGGLELEGHRVTPIEVGHTDTDNTTVLHVPSIDLVVAGDAVYNGVHQMLMETGTTGFQSWLAALDTIEALHPRAVVAGHKNPDLPDDPAAIEHTRRYLVDAQRLLAESPTPQQFFDEMVARYPDRLNIGPVWYGAHGLLGVEMPT